MTQTSVTDAIETGVPPDLTRDQARLLLRRLATTDLDWLRMAAIPAEFRRRAGIKPVRPKPAGPSAG